MLYKDEITLASVSTKRDKDGFPEADVQLTEVFADVQSAKRREFYEALPQQTSQWRSRAGSEASIMADRSM